jgi:hypothetical protein
MSSTEMPIPEGFMKNAAGHLVPVDKVREHDLLRDQVAGELAATAISINAQLAAFKKKALADIADLVSVSADRYDVKLGGKKGNVSITTFNGKYKIERAYADLITFTEEILAAKALIDQCISEWTDGANSNLRVVVENTFRANRKGEIKTSDVLKLLRYEIDDPAWLSAMDALRDSIMVTGTAVYIRVYVREGDTDRYVPIPLNLAVV